MSAACHGTPPVRREPGLNVLLITIDTWRADALGASGSARAVTPVLDSLAARGVRFASAHAHNVLTLPSHANILSGRYPMHHRVRENSGFRLSPEVETLATMLHAHGYRTGAFVSAFPLDRRFGLARGFDVYDDRYGKSRDRGAFRVAERSGAETVAAALAWLGDPSGEPARQPWFAWVHLYEPHFPYAPPEPFASRFASQPYWGEVAAADAALAPLVDPIVQRGANDRVLVVVTGDHGEALGEHGEATHGLFAYEGTLHVPLIVYAPRLFGTRVVGDPVRHIDILPTVLDALGLPAPDGIDGRSLLETASKGAPFAAPSYFESLSGSLNRGWAPLYGVLRGSAKYVELPIPELYDVAADPSEQRNLVATRPKDTNELQQLLQILRSDDLAVRPGPENAETRDRLRSLGYVSAVMPLKSRYTEADDPKRLVDVDRGLDEVVSIYQRGDLQGAIAAAERLRRERPDMPVALVHLAFLYNEAGNHAAAVSAIERALALNPAAQDTAALAGTYLTEAGRPRDAIARLAPYAHRPQPDVDVLIAYGVALADAGHPQEALDAFGRARAADPENGLPLVNIGALHLQQGETDRAAAAYEEAVRIDPTLARVHNGLGVIAAARRDYDGALGHWRRAVELEPGDYQALYNLGDLLVQLGRPSEARAYWERYVQVAPPAVEARDIARVRRWLAGSRR